MSKEQFTATKKDWANSFGLSLQGHVDTWRTLIQNVCEEGKGSNDENLKLILSQLLTELTKYDNIGDLLAFDMQLKLAVLPKFEDKWIRACAGDVRLISYMLEVASAYLADNFPKASKLYGDCHYKISELIPKEKCHRQ